MIHPVSLLVLSSAVTLALSASLNQTGNANATEQAKIYDQAFAYVEVRPGAFMFWWLYMAGNSDVEHDYLKYPLVIYLAGGPGDSSTGYSNFMEIGPKNEKMEDRAGNWVEHANVLFIDSPVGSGFSYVTKDDLLVKTDEEIVSDLITCLDSFFNQTSDLKTVPTYIFGESYGGKVATKLATEIHKRNLNLFNLIGVGIGDGAIDLPLSNSLWPTYLNTLGLIDSVEKEKGEVIVAEIQQAIKTGKGQAAFDGWLKLFQYLQDATHYIDFHNILHGNKFYPGSQTVDPLDDVMNKQIKPYLRVIPETVSYNGQAKQVFETLGPVFMNPVVDDIDYLLNQTNYKIAVYNGQLDVIIPTVSVEAWISHLTWPDKDKFITAGKIQISGDKADPAAFAKKFGRLSLYYVLKAGHSVPRDQLQTSVDVLNDFFK